MWQPDHVSRILSAGSLRHDGHSSGPRITTRLKRPTRRFGAPSRHAPGRSLRSKNPGFLPIWSCSVWGLPCPLHCWNGGALLPHLFTLTSTLPPRRYVFCGTCRQLVLKPASRTLSGTLLCGVRTFLSPHPKDVASGRPVQLPTPRLYSISYTPRLDCGGTLWQTTHR